MNVKKTHTKLLRAPFLEQTCQEVGDFRSPAVAGLVSCRHSDVVDLTALKTTEEAAGAVGVTVDHRDLVYHSLNRI